MQRLSSFSLFILAAFVVFLSAACDPVECPAGLIPINDTDATAPDVYWEIRSLSMTPSGPASSLTLLPGYENTYEMSTNEVVTVFLVAEDNESGVKTISVSGGFGYSCAQGEGNIFIVDGIIPSNPINFTSSMTCATPEGAYQVTVIDPANFCSGPGISFRNGTYGFDGIVENNADDIRLTRLIINVNSEGL